MITKIKSFINDVVPRSHRHSFRFWSELLLQAVLMPFICTAWWVWWAYSTAVIVKSVKNKREAITGCDGLLIWLLYPIILVAFIVGIVPVLVGTIICGVIELKNMVIRSRDNEGIKPK